MIDSRDGVKKVCDEVCHLVSENEAVLNVDTSRDREASLNEIPTGQTGDNLNLEVKNIINRL